CARGVDDYDYW
nr:immunoglobulin heavy chain junction region [Mus musculus]